MDSQTRRNRPSYWAVVRRVAVKHLCTGLQDGICAASLVTATSVDLLRLYSNSRAHASLSLGGTYDASFKIRVVAMPLPHASHGLRLRVRARLLRLWLRNVTLPASDGARNAPTCTLDVHCHFHSVECAVERVYRWPCHDLEGLQT